MKPCNAVFLGLEDTSNQNQKNKSNVSWDQPRISRIRGFEDPEDFENMLTAPTMYLIDRLV